MDNQYHFDQKPIAPRSLVDPQSIGWTRFEKRVYRLWDIPSAGNGSEIALGETGELQLFTDNPIDVSLETPGNWFRVYSTIYLTGRITKVFVRTINLPANQLRVGRLVMFVGRPSLGTNFQRENPIQYGHGVNRGMTITLPVPNWAAGAATMTFTIKLTTNLEAAYMFALRITRSAGTIDSVLFSENESGTVQGIAVVQALAPTNILYERFANPVRMAATAITATVTGSVEPGNTDITVQIENCNV